MSELVKVVLPSGNHAVFETSRHLAAPEDVFHYAAHYATRFSGGWYRVSHGRVGDKLHPSEARRLEALPVLERSAA